MFFFVLFLCPSCLFLTIVYFVDNPSAVDFWCNCIVLGVLGFIFRTHLQLFCLKVLLNLFCIYYSYVVYKEYLKLVEGYRFEALKRKYQQK